MRLPPIEALKAVIQIDRPMRDYRCLLVTGTLALVQVLLVMVPTTSFGCFEASPLLGVIVLKQDSIISYSGGDALLDCYVLLLCQAAVCGDLSVKVAWQQISISSETQILRIELHPV